jgi:hypothetical protein
VHWQLVPSLTGTETTRLDQLIGRAASVLALRALALDAASKVFAMYARAQHAAK